MVIQLFDVLSNGNIGMVNHLSINFPMYTKNTTWFMLSQFNVLFIIHSLLIVNEPLLLGEGVANLLMG